MATEIRVPQACLTDWVETENLKAWGALGVAVEAKINETPFFLPGVTVNLKWTYAGNGIFTANIKNDWDPFPGEADQPLIVKVPDE